MLQEPQHIIPQGMTQSIPQPQIPYQENSIVYPFMQQGLP